MVADRADLRVVSRGFEDAVKEISEAGDARPDVVVAGGANGAYLKSRVAVPVVLINPTEPVVIGDDVGISAQVAIWTHGYHAGHPVRDGHAAAFADTRVIRCAVNQDFADPATALRDGDEVAFFPPVTGG